MKLGPGFKPDTGAGLGQAHEKMQDAQSKLAKWMRDQYAHYYKQKENWLELHLRRLMPGFVVDNIIRWNSLLPTRLFGVKFECIEFQAEGIEVMILRRFGRMEAAKIFIPPSSYIDKGPL